MIYFWLYVCRAADISILERQLHSPMDCIIISDNKDKSIHLQKTEQIIVVYIPKGILFRLLRAENPTKCSVSLRQGLMWNIPLYAEYQWLKKKRSWAYLGQNRGVKGKLK